VKGAAGSLVVLVNWLGAWAVSYTFNFLMSWSASGKENFPTEHKASALFALLSCLFDFLFLFFSRNFFHLLCILCDDCSICGKVSPRNQRKNTRRNSGMHQLVEREEATKYFNGQYIAGEDLRQFNVIFAQVSSMFGAENFKSDHGKKDNKLSILLCTKFFFVFWGASIVYQILWPPNR
jgi:hypothetical protein